MFESHERGTPVRLMATMGGLETAGRDEPFAAALGRARPCGFDFLPVRDERAGTIIGLLRPQDVDPDAGRVGEVMEPLSGAILIGADAPLLQFVCEADRTPCRLVLDGAAISGIVTLSDLQRLPVRTAVFGLFIHLEMFLTQTSRDIKAGGDDPIAQLPQVMRGRARRQWRRAESQGMQRDQWSVLVFSEKVALAVVQPAFAPIADRMGADLQFVVERLRNPIAHGNEFALTRRDACDAAVATRLLYEWTVWFRNWRRSRLGVPPPAPATGVTAAADR